MAQEGVSQSVLALKALCRAPFIERDYVFISTMPALRFRNPFTGGSGGV